MSNNISDIISKALEYQDKSYIKYKSLFDRVARVQHVEAKSDMDRSVITLYDANNEKLLESRYELVGIFSSYYDVWCWGWSLPTVNKNMSYKIREILNYGLNLDEKSNLFIKYELLSSRLKIRDKIQLDIYPSLAAYLAKCPIIYEQRENVKIFDSDEYVSYFLFLLDLE